MAQRLLAFALTLFVLAPVAGPPPTTADPAQEAWPIYLPVALMRAEPAKPGTATPTPRVTPTPSSTHLPPPTPPTPTEPAPGPARPEYVHEPRGARADGTTGVTHLEDSYHFRFEGDERLEYVVDVSHPDVQRGLLRIEERTTGALPVAQGGLAWRTGSRGRAVISPAELAAQASVELVEERFDEEAGVLALTYREVIGDVAAAKSYTFWLAGKVLKVRLAADPGVNRGFVGNYTGVRTGPSDHTPDPAPIHIPYMDSVPVVRFGGSLFYTVFIDWYRSNGGNITAYGPTQTDDDSFELFFGSTSYSDEESRILAPVDETLNVLVTRQIHDTFPVVAHARSPYYDLLAGRMIFNAANQTPGAWNSYRLHWQALAEWGIDQLAGNMFGWEKYGLNLLDPDRDVAGIMGCDPAEVVRGAQDRGTGLTFVDPNDPANMALADREFGALMDELRTLGHPVALYQDSGHLDQQGHGPYGSGNAYPTHRPLNKPGWGSLGLLVPAVNDLYDPAPIVHNARGEPKYGWDTSANLQGTSWDEDPDRTKGDGHPLHVVSPTFLHRHYVDDMAPAVAKYQPGAVFIDAVTEVPSWNVIDEISTSGKVHTIGEAIAQTRDALAAQKAAVGGPLFGENSHWRYKQWESYESGLWDGRHRSMAIPLTPSEGRPQPNADFVVIPDYELLEVLPLTSAHHGMGWENQHMPTAYPIDGPDGKKNDFLDSWWTNIVTFGHSPFFSTNGHVPNNHRTMEGIIREYYLLAGLHGAIVASPVQAIRYVGGDVAEYDLGAALTAGLDLTNPRVHISYENGLEVYANHDVAGGTTWQVTVADAPHAAPGEPAAFDIPPNGFVATDGRGLLVYSAINPDTGLRADYARIPAIIGIPALGNRWEMLSSRGTPQTYAGFPSVALLAAFDEDDRQRFAAGTVVRNEVHNIAVGANGGLWRNRDWQSGKVEAVQLGPAPMLSDIIVTARTKELSVGGQIGVTALGRFQTINSPGLIMRNLTTLAEWTAWPEGVVRIDRNGGVTGLTAGRASIRASYDPDGPGGEPPAPSAVLEVEVAKGP